MIYEYNGEHYDIDTEDPSVAKEKIYKFLGKTTVAPQPEESSLTKFGHGVASLADTGFNAASGALDYLAYPVARAYYGTQMSPEQAAQRAQQETTSPKNPIGNYLGITQSPSYQNELSNRVMGGVGNVVHGVAQPLSQSTGLPVQDVEHMIGTGLTAAGPYVPKVAGAISDVGKQAITNGGQFVKGTGGVLGNAISQPGAEIKPWETPSARQPATETYMPADELNAWRNGQISTEQLKSSMVPYTPEQIQALQRTKGNVPLNGQVYQAAGEQFGEHLKSPYTWATELGAGALGGLMGGPVGAGVGVALPLIRKGYKAIQGAKDISANKTLGNLNFTSLSPEEQAALQQNFPHPVTGPVQPQSVPQPTIQPQANYPLTVQGSGQTLPPSTIPMGTNPRAVNIEGQRSVLPYQINTTNSQAARPPSIPQVAASKIIPVQPTPLAQQAADWAKRSGGGYTPPANMSVPTAQPITQPITKVTQPVVQKTVVQTTRTPSEIRKEMDIIGNQNDLLHQHGLENKIQYGTPEGELHQARLGELSNKMDKLQSELEAATKAEKSALRKSAKKKVPEVSQMLTEETVFPNKEEFDKANLFNTLAGKKPVGGYREGENIVRHEVQNYGDWPEEVKQHLPEVSIVKRNSKGKRVE